jgi:tetratricopeptide (TPR) repeat protein
MNKLLAALLVCFAALELSAAPPSRTILVLPFENKSSRTDIGWLSESFAETLSTRLSGSGRLVLSRIERDAALREAGIAQGAPMTWASAFKVAESLGADWVVTGTFSVNGEVLTSHAYLLDIGRLKMSGPWEVNGQLADLADIQTRLAWRILAMQDQNFTVGAEEDFRRQFPVLRLDAHENYIRGVLATDPETRVRFLTEADRRDPSDHRAAFELGRFYYEKKDYENSAKWLGKLAPSDANSFEARFMKGVNEFFLGHDAAAEKAFTELSQKVPLAEVWNNLGFLQARHGRWIEAIMNFDRAYQADPSDPDFSFNLGVCMWNEGKHAVAVRYFREAVQTAPDDTEIHRLLGEALAKTGDLEGKKKEDEWLEGKGEELEKDGNSGILPSPRLKKRFDRRSYRARIRGANPAQEVTQRSTPAAAPAEAKP